MNLIAKLVLAAAACLPIAAHAITFTPGDYYASTGQAINHYGTNGALLESLDMPGFSPETRGIAFGGDGNLYVVRNSHWTGTKTIDASVDVFNSGGTKIRSHSLPGWISGMSMSGNIQFAPTGDHFYVAALDGIYRFTVGKGAGTKLIDTTAIDLKVLANGDLLVAGAHTIERYDATGKQVSVINRYLADPLGLTASMSSRGAELVDVRGIEYDAASNTTFVTMLGYSGGSSSMNFKLLALDGFSNRLKGIADYWYGGDMALTGDGRLLVGSAATVPGIFLYVGGMPLALSAAGSFEGGQATFVTAIPVPAPVPEPDTVILLGLGLIVLTHAARRQRAASGRH